MLDTLDQIKYYIKINFNYFFLLLLTQKLENMKLCLSLTLCFH